MLFQLDWPYYRFNPQTGKLYSEDGPADVPAFTESFSNASAAQQWLEDNDIRGTVE